ncbi:MAG TPA: hypothetical protein VEG42_04835 [Thermoplasmata archaeon]|jgi:hypothetical protein|nr:hypothetical protein [Thermoplasmata archaeon]
MSAAIRKGSPAPLEPLVEIPPRHVFLGQGEPRGYGVRPKLTPEAAAAFATYVDSARARAAMEGRTLVYTVRWG